MDGGKEESAARVDYLRISLTDRCNLRCIYCMPNDGVKSFSREEVMRYEEFAQFVESCASLGISKVRITGGEPLVRKGIVDFIRMLASVELPLQISMTTNGTLLGDLAEDLRDAGLKRVNISIDSLEEEKYRTMTRGGNLADALRGLEAAIRVGFSPIKVNTVVLRGVNDDPSLLARLTFEMPVHVRFIEYMPYFSQRGKWFVSNDETKKRLERIGRLEEAESPAGSGPANYFKFPGAMGTIGFISPVSSHFCRSCNRLRISSDGKLRTCLFERDGIDVKRIIRGGASARDIRSVVSSALERKRREGGSKPRDGVIPAEWNHMSRIGG
ncbi:MAG: GTP 3',8-cyclase MoaA [Actinomycetota bacterium]|nr:GTP 3',8-cyclase MoaA [Actinomycetota bacterium]